MQRLSVAVKHGQPILLGQVADVTFAPAIKRGDAGYNGGPAVVLGIQKQPAADTIRLTEHIETALSDLARTLQPGWKSRW